MFQSDLEKEHSIRCAHHEIKGSKIKKLPL